MATVDRLEKDRVLGPDEDGLVKFIDGDARIRSGMCPNGHGHMIADVGGQKCKTCWFWTNMHAEIGTK